MAGVIVRLFHPPFLPDGDSQMNRRILPGLVVVLIASAACSTDVSTNAEHSAAQGPSLDTGVMHGSGNRSDSTTANATAATSDEATATEKEGTGVMHGSGN
jgi:hypothetical protein